MVDRWLTELDRFCERIGPRFGRVEPRSRAARYMCGLAAGLDRRNGWTIAEHAGEVSPDGMQRLLRRAEFDVDGVRDDVRELVVGHLGDPDAVLVIDDTGFLKKGRRSAGVQRQYSGTAGRTENCQIGVFMAYVSATCHALIDRDLYLPQSWIDDRARCRQAGIPDAAQFATKPRIAIAMLQRAIEGGVPFGWVAADEVYGQVPYLRTWLEDKRIPYVLATRRDDTVSGRDWREVVCVQDLATLPAAKWKRISCGAGAHGQRFYDWARLPVRPEWRHGFGHWVMARRSISDPTDIAYYLCYAPARTTLTRLARTAGRRWPVEECFQQAKNEAGLDQYQARDWRAWYAHITLSMATHALLVVAKSLATQANPASRRTC
ncbi:IS701 family transposase [Asanoa hainanensis]|nr:IS701 family transposase [Asanoa hainanensis]